MCSPFLERAVQKCHTTGDCFCCSQDSCCTAPQGDATSTRTSWLNDLTILRLASRCSSCTQAGSAMRMLLWRCTGSGGGTLDRMRVSCRQAARHCCAMQTSNLSIPSVSLSRGHVHQPAIPFELEEFQFVVNLRTSRSGAAAGPSGMTSDHLRPLLDHVLDSHLLFLLGDQLAKAHTSASVNDAIRRLVARTVPHQLSKAVESASAPFQYAMTTMAGTVHRPRPPSTDRVEPPMHHHDRGCF